MNAPYYELAAAVTQVVREVAAQVVMPRYLQVVREHKADGTIFTEVDIAAQRALAERLQRLRPRPLLGEEEMAEEEQRQLWQEGSAGLWVVDPIDGTTNFVAGLPFFAISVAYFIDGRAVVGVVYNPATREMFFASRGGGAIMNGLRLPLRPPAASLAECVAGVDFKRIPKKLGDALATRPPYYSQRNFGCSTLEWAYAAAGRLDLLLHGGQKLWDYAAGRLILEEAGGGMCTLKHDDFDADDLWKRSVIAAVDPQLFSAWRDWIRARR
ncbi:MAG TPA: inositol monophosphatase family protein [Candidatus Desulfobacillus sp.]|nr:inositol monophosphatase family protein [Candidatus Desulfobacillus sp.]